VAPYVILSVPAGIVADRYDRRRILIVTDVARGALMVLLAALVTADAAVGAIVVVAIGAACFSAFFGPAMGAYMPTLVRDESDLGPANTVYATLNELTLIVGPAIGAVIVAALDLSVAFLVNALSFAIVAAVLWTLPSHVRPRQGTAGAEPDGAGGTASRGATVQDGPLGRPPARPGFRWREAARPLTALAIMDGAGGFVFGGVSVLTVVIAYDLLGTGEAGTGLLNAAVGVGGLVGSLVTGFLVLRRRLGPPILLGAASLGLGLVGLGLSGSLVLSMVAIATASAGALLAEVIFTTLLQRMAPDEVRGRAFGVVETVDVLLFAVGSFVIPAAVAGAGVPAVLLASGVGVVIVIAVGTWLLGDWAAQSPPADPARDALVRVPAFERLAPARLEAAQRRATVLAMRAGDVVIRQGDEADRFYVIVDGEMEVSQSTEEGGEPVVLRRLGTDDSFGEIGLLSGVPRTATVTAVSDGQLLALDKEAFLDLVADASDLAFPAYDPYLGRAPVRS
jgi:MFS family permease